MSDPLTNSEVEDVLSSIRRLVSDDKRAEAVDVAAPAQDRLVLTPALRVSDETGAEPPARTVRSEAMDTEPEPADEEDIWVADPWEEGSSDTDVSEASAWPEADAQDEDTDTPRENENDVGTDAEAPADDTETPDHDLAHDPHEADDSAAAMAPADPAEDPQDAVDPIELSDAFAPEADAPEDAPADDPVPEESARDTDLAPEDTSQPNDPDGDATEQPNPSLGDKIAALETLIAGQNQQWEPDDAGTDPYAGTDAPAMAWEDAGDDEPVKEPTRPQTAEVHDIYEADPDPQIFASDEDVLDEEALRDLVADIVREELQGALGERITRNVRKLVRREIHRALAAQDLE